MKTAFALALLISTSALASNLPNFGGAQMIGRVAYFPSPRGTNWFLPLALSPQLYCSPDAATRSCIVKVVNFVNPQEIAGLTQSMPMTPLNPMIVKSVSERFVGLQGTEMKLQTLAQNERGPYASIALRGDRASMATLEQKFSNEGLGSFESEVVMNAESVGEYLAVENTDTLKAQLGSLSGKLSKQDMTSAIARIVPTLQLHAYNVDAQDAKQTAAEQIRYQFFRYTRFKGYEVDLEQMPSRLVLRDEHSAPYEVRCLVSLQLKAGAVPQVGCQ